MNIVSFWNTVGAANLEASKAFYAALGFGVQDGPPGVPCFTVQFGQAGTLCVFAKDAFSGLIPGAICNPRSAQEFIQSISLEKNSDVDELARLVDVAGGERLGDPKHEPFGYAFGFTDLDGHVFAVLCFGG